VKFQVMYCWNSSRCLHGSTAGALARPVDTTTMQEAGGE